MFVLEILFLEHEKAYLVIFIPGVAPSFGCVDPRAPHVSLVKITTDETHRGKTPSPSRTSPANFHGTQAQTIPQKHPSDKSLGCARIGHAQSKKR